MPLSLDHQPRGLIAANIASRVIDRHRYQGDSNDCGPFCAAMVAEALTGAELDPEALAAALNRPRPGGLWGVLPLIRRIPRFATFPWGVVDALRARGLRARWRRGTTEAELRGWLAAGLGIIVLVGGWSLRPAPWGHYMVLLAHDPARGWGFADPGRPGKEIRWWAEDAFRGKWAAMGRVAVVVGGGGSGERMISVAKPG